MAIGISKSGAISGPESDTALPERFRRTRKTSQALAAPLEIEDMVLQSMPDASPTRWHLAHTTWFFEHFVLSAHLDGYEEYRPGWGYLFNSYYYTVGDMFRRPQRGLLSRPTVQEVLAYRKHVDEFMGRVLEQRAGDPDFDFLIEVGINHEQQHQELILTDIKHALSLNPLQPAYRDDLTPVTGSPAPLRFRGHDGGVVRIGWTGSGFCFDNETPRHDTLLQPFELASRLVTNGEYRDFIADGGYSTSELWLSDGWATVQEHDWKRPLYWSEDLQSEFSLAGPIELDPHRPVCHLSYYEADAYARWAGARLPTEAEWESVASAVPVEGNLLDSGRLHPSPLGDGEDGQWFGDTWEWTASPYGPYPGFTPLAGSLGEYNGKFMCSQMVLRGGSCATPADHIRASYRNFFYPQARWQMSGIRLARNIK